MIIERDVAQWLEKGAWSFVNVAVCRAVSNPAWPILGHFFDVVSLGKTLHHYILHLTQM